jgi:hypothetical protein
MLMDEQLVIGLGDPFGGDDIEFAQVGRRREELKQGVKIGAG